MNAEPRAPSTAREERLAELLNEVRACFTRDDDLPDNLLPRIDAELDGAAGALRSDPGQGT